MTTDTTTRPTEIEEVRTLPSGRRVRLRMPHLYRLLASVRGIPNPKLAAVLKLLAGEGNLEATNELQRLTSVTQMMRGLYEVAELCLVEPKLRLDLKEGETPGPGEIGPDELPIADAEVIYYGFFRRGPGAGFGPGTGAPNAQPAPDAGPDGDALSLSAEPAAGGGSDE